MAQRTVISLVDDIDGSEGAETVRFSIDGQSYEIDLNAERAEHLRERLAPYVANARPVGKRTIAALRATRRPGKDYDPAEVRAWAVGQGIEVNGRGRLPADLIEKYKADRL